MKSTNRVAKFRLKQAKDGWVRKEIKIKPEWWEAIKSFIAKLG